MTRIFTLLGPLFDYDPAQRLSTDTALVEKTLRSFLRLYCPELQSEMDGGSEQYRYSSSASSNLELALYGITELPGCLIADPIPGQIGHYIRRTASEVVTKPPRTESFNQMLIRADLALELSGQYLRQMRQTLELQRVVARVCDFDHTLGTNFPDLVGIRRP